MDAYRNADHALLHGYDGPLPRVFDTNAVACALGASMQALDRVRGTLTLAFLAVHPSLMHEDGRLSYAAALAMIDFALGLVALSVVPPPAGIATVRLEVLSLKPFWKGPWTAESWVEQRDGGRFGTRAVLRSAHGDVVLSG